MSRADAVAYRVDPATGDAYVTTPDSREVRVPAAMVQSAHEFPVGFLTAYRGGALAALDEAKRRADAENLWHIRDAHMIGIFYAEIEAGAWPT